MIDKSEKCEVSGSIVSLEEELRPLRANGYWWRPGRDTKAPGEIVFSHGEEGAALHLFGYPDETKNFNGFLRGCVHPMRHFALLHCQEYQSNTSRGYGLGTESAALDFIDMWVGDLGFDFAEDIAFESLSFGITNLGVWLGRGCFPPRNNNSNHVEFSRLIFEDDLVRVYLAFVPVESVMDRGSRCQSTRREACIFIRSKNGLLPYYGETKSFEYYENRLTAFFGLLVGTVSARYGRCGRADYPLSETVNDVGVVWRLNRRPMPSKLLTPLKRDALFIPYDEIADELPHITENFFKLNDEIAGICGRLVYFRTGQTSIPYGGVPELVFMFEGLARNLYEKDIRLKNEQMPQWPIHVANVEKVNVLLKDEPELLKWLSRKMEFKLSGIQELFEIARLQMREAFYHLENDQAWMAYTKYLRARRDGFAHSECKLIGHDKMYLAAYFWLEGFLMGMVLRKCGVSADVIRRGISRCSDFRHGIDTYYEEFVKGSVCRT